MFIEHRTYSVKPGRVGDYLQGYAGTGWALHSAHAPCLGHYTTEAGELFRIVSLWQYESFEDRLERRARLNADPRWRETMERVSPLVTDLRSSLLVPSVCWKDDGWLRALYADFDGMRSDAFLGALSDDVAFAFGARSANGKAQVREALAGLRASFKAMRHTLGAVVREADRTAVESTLECTRADGRAMRLPCAAVIERRSGLVTSFRTYVDLSPADAT